MGVFALLRIAARNLSRNRRRSLITLLAMFVAVTMMVTMRGFINSMDRLLRDTFVEAQMGALQIHRTGFLESIVASPLDLDLPADAQFLSKVRAVPHVKAVAARIPGGGMAIAHDRSVFMGFLALDPAEEIKVCPKHYADLKTGAAPQPDSATGSALTQLLLTRLGSHLGERVALLTSDRDGVMNAVDIEVRGALKDAGLFAAEKKLAFIPLSSAQELLRMPDRATELAISVDDLNYVDEVAATLRKTLGPDYEVSTWRELTSFDKDASKTRDLGGSFITYVFLVVALLGIANTMLMSVRERTREIGTMMAVGMRRRNILALFLTEAALIGLGGGLLGIIVGGGLVHHFGIVGIKLPRPDDATMMNEFHPYVTTAYMIKIQLVAVFGAVAAAMYPARRASRLRPIEALSLVAT